VAGDHARRLESFCAVLRAKAQHPGLAVFARGAAAVLVAWMDPLGRNRDGEPMTARPARCMATSGHHDRFHGPQRPKVPGGLPCAASSGAGGIWPSPLVRENDARFRWSSITDVAEKCSRIKRVITDLIFRTERLKPSQGPAVSVGHSELACVTTLRRLRRVQPWCGRNRPWWRPCPRRSPSAGYLLRRVRPPCERPIPFL